MYRPYRGINNLECRRLGFLQDFAGSNLRYVKETTDNIGRERIKKGFLLNCALLSKSG